MFDVLTTKTKELNQLVSPVSLYHHEKQVLQDGL